MTTSFRFRLRSLIFVVGAAATVAVGGVAAAQADELPPPPECIPGPSYSSDANGCLLPPKHHGAVFAPERLQTIVPDRAFAAPPRELHDRSIWPRPGQPVPGCGGPLVFCP
ncbi:hypothetical protein [Rhodococcus sp. NPDC058514]|uniref:hypothetical protein n=1 Tax=unclassified Rhodococcus (in: high G+C Gram-positive bacteria) TaxID=192944 RepID=UPI0036495206